MPLIRAGLFMIIVAIVAWSASGEARFSPEETNAARLIALFVGAVGAVFVVVELISWGRDR
jgi:hypothetical protein